MSNIKASIITIGDELLIGQTIDTNSAWIAQELNLLGIDVVRRVAVGDVAADIREALTEELRRSELVLITGGLGPTADDITKPLLCDFFQGKLVIDEAVLAHVKQIFKTRNRPFLDVNLRQAEVPDVCTVLPNELGTAPGMWFEQEGKVTVSLPGVPFEMIHIMQQVALPKLKAYFKSDAIVHRSIVTAGEGESFVADRIKDLEAALPAHIRLAYLPGPGGVRLRLTGRAADELQLIKEVELHRDGIAARIAHLIVSLDDLPLEHILGKLLAGRNLSLGLAESCTGGYIAHLLTQIMGAAQYFNGSVVCYQNDAKEDLLGVQRKTIEKHHVISEAVALEMAEGARKALRSDIGFGITGLLSGSSEAAVPVGTVCMAVTDGSTAHSRTLRFHLDRLRNKELAVNAALLYIWKFVQGTL